MTRIINEAFDFNGGGYTNADFSQYSLIADWEKKSQNKGFEHTIKYAPDNILYVRSVPTGVIIPKIYPDISLICRILQYRDYHIFPICMFRDFDTTVASQLNKGHVQTITQARFNISHARDFIINSYGLCSLLPICIKYELLIDSLDYRKMIESTLNINPIQTVLYNANTKYPKNPNI